MIKITSPFDFAYGGTRVVSLKQGAMLPDHDEAAQYAVDVGFGDASEDAVEEEEATEAVPEWPLKTPPEKYLEKTPDGPKADLARKILGS